MRPYNPPNNFKRDLAYSLQENLFGDFYKEWLGPLLERVEKVEDLDFQKLGIDAILTLKGGKKIYIDEKLRRKKWDDLLIEIYSDYQNQTPGWLFNTQTDYIAYAFESTREVNLFPLLLLRVWYEDHKNELTRFEKVFADNGNYKTLSIAIPLHVIKREILEVYNC